MDKTIREHCASPESTKSAVSAVVAGELVKGGHAKSVIDAPQLHDPIGSKGDFSGHLAVIIHRICADPLKRRNELVQRDGRVRSPVIKDAAAPERTIFFLISKLFIFISSVWHWSFTVYSIRSMSVIVKGFYKFYAQ